MGRLAHEARDFISIVHPWTLLSERRISILARSLPTAVCARFIFPLMYYLIVSDIRYRYPVLWLTLLPAGHFLSWLANQLAARWSPSRTRDLATP